jgi:hypothetical protein
LLFDKERLLVLFLRLERFHQTKNFCASLLFVYFVERRFLIRKIKHSLVPQRVKPRRAQLHALSRKLGGA